MKNKKKSYDEDDEDEDMDDEEERDWLHSAVFGQETFLNLPAFSAGLYGKAPAWPPEINQKRPGSSEKHYFAG